MKPKINVEHGNRYRVCENYVPMYLCMYVHSCRDPPGIKLIRKIRTRRSESKEM